MNIIEMEKLRYSIIYAVIRPEITERVSIGLITVGGGKVDVKYSRKKLDALRLLFPQSKYQYLRKVVMSLSKNQNIGNEGDVSYLSRYSNNLVSVSPLQTIDIEPTEKSSEWLYRNYIFDRAE